MFKPVKITAFPDSRLKAEHGKGERKPSVRLSQWYDQTRLFEVNMTPEQAKRVAQSILHAANAAEFGHYSEADIAE